MRDVTAGPLARGRDWAGCPWYLFSGRRLFPLIFDAACAHMTAPHFDSRASHAPSPNREPCRETLSIPSWPFSLDDASRVLPPPSPPPPPLHA